MTPLLTGKPISEHAGYPNGIALETFDGTGPETWTGFQTICFKCDAERPCILLSWNKLGQKTIQSSYYVGTDWIKQGEIAVYVEPKLNQNTRSTDYFNMLFEGLSNPEISTWLPDIFELKTEQPPIQLSAQLDLLTPLLIYQYLSVLNGIVKKGLKKGYAAVEENLAGRVKGKILLGKQLRGNVWKSRPTHVHCQFNRFSTDISENRVLKRALDFATRYIHSLDRKNGRESFDRLACYIRPAFQEVADDPDAENLRHFKVSAFFKEYRKALHLARLIFQRYGYNINTIKPAEKIISVPPFWIDMSKLYELYVLAKLRKQMYGANIHYQFKGRRGIPDFLLTGDNPMIVDAKYKPYYDQSDAIGDIRQLSGYARDEGILEKLQINTGTPGELQRNYCIDCLIIYPLGEASENQSLELSMLKNDPITDFRQFFKIAVELPFQK